MARIAIITHEGTFHCDEILATALIKCFYAKDADYVDVIRVNHNNHTGSELVESFTKFYDVVFVIDVGRELDEDKKLFDHHQFDPKEFRKASSGLVYDWLRENNLIPESIMGELNKITEISDLHDIGIRKAQPGELPWIVANFNTDNPYGKQQHTAFNEALRFLYKMLKGLKRKAERLEEAKRRLTSEVKIVEELTKDGWKVLKFENGFIPNWQYVLPVIQEFSDVDIVYWYDENKQKWKAQVVPVKPDSFDRRNRALENLDVPGKVFIHNGKFFAVFETEDDLINYLKQL